MIYIIKKYLIPSTLNRRFLLLIIAPIFLIQTFTTYFFCERHWDDLKFRVAQSVAQDLVILHNLSVKNNYEDLKNFAKILKFKINLGKDCNNTLKNIRYKDQEISKLESQLKKYSIDHQFYYIKDSGDILGVLYYENDRICITIPKKRLYMPTTHVFLFWISFTSLIVVIITIIFVRNQLRSINRLAKAVDDFGKNIEIKDFKPEGAYEIRKAGYSFLKMKERIDRQMTQRTEMLNAISHDLRTPLTRIKLELEMLPIEITDMKADIVEMEKMIDEYLAFASISEIENKTTVDIVGYVKKTVERFQKIHPDINFISEVSSLLYNFSPTMLARALNNIIDNGIKYGKVVEVSLHTSSNFIYINIDDMGNGIEQEDIQNIFKPFVRIKQDDASVKGVGLGLTIANDIIINHGGIINVSSSKKFTGICFTIILPYKD